MLNVAYAMPPVNAATKRSAASVSFGKQHQQQKLAAAIATPQHQQQLRRKTASDPGTSGDQHALAQPNKQQQQQQQHKAQSEQTQSEQYELRQRQLRHKREEVTWETSSYDRERGRMVRSLNVVERNRLAETERQLRREMEQRMRDIRQEQTAVLLVHSSASRSSGSNGRASSHQDLASCGSSSTRSHSSTTTRFY